MHFLGYVNFLTFKFQGPKNTTNILIDSQFYSLIEC